MGIADDYNQNRHPNRCDVFPVDPKENVRQNDKSLFTFILWKMI